MTMTRTDIINLLVKKTNAKAYLEIGVRNPHDNFNKIECVVKHGVDPALPPGMYSQGTGYQTSSDIYFEHVNKDISYDVIFIDGLHTEEQVDKDISNSLSRLAEGGYIVLHDCNPPNKEHESPGLCGTVWRSIYKLRKTSTELNVRVVDTDYGCGIVSRGAGVPLTIETPEKSLNYTFLDKHRKELLNLIGEVDFVTSIVTA